ncbi:aminopeptidase [Pendulispora rubella]|uniref:Aminopeptidase N n=1 Tax=Pendulispora rubella TaxID=2741070 RepID=A0ABZ2LDV0_9BACT
MNLLRAKHLGVLSLTLLVAACSSASDDPGATPSVDLGVNDSTAGTNYDVERYDVKGELDWARHRLVATVSIQLRGHGTVVLDSAVSEINAVRLDDGTPLPFAVDREHQKLRVDLPANAETVRLEIDYEAEGAVSGGVGQGARLYMVPALKGDPAAVRAAYTFSERYGAHWWMPSHDVPSDRAFFSVDMRIPAHEKLIANGDLVSDEIDGATKMHRVKYESGFTLPTYIMAFNVADFEVETAHVRSGDRHVPLSIWHRRGIPNDYRTSLRETARAMKAFEALVGPYPFKSYSQVFMPGDWGEENATITLMGESYLDYSLSDGIDVAGHELAHQWFGDLVTNETFYDAWFKEGMATLLEMENLRGYLDEENVGLLGGDRQRPREGEPIVRDRSIPITSYGTGPYARAAWLLSQIRSRLGDAPFWQTLRGVLREHAYGTMGTDAFIDAFAPHLGAETTAAVRRAVVAKSIPRLHVESAPDGAVVTLRDPEGALITPMVVRWVSPDGSSREQTLALDTPVTLSRQTPGEFLVIDPQDVHPDAKVFATQDGASSDANYETSVAPLLVPQGQAAIAQWLRAGGLHQIATLSHALPALAPGEFGAFVRELDAKAAETLAIQRACDVAVDPKLDAATRAAWSGVIGRALRQPPPAVGLAALGTKRWATCGKVVDVERLFAVDWARLEAFGSISENRIAFLSQFDLPPVREFSIWSRVATHADTLNQRKAAVTNLSRYATESRVPVSNAPSWREFFVALLSDSQDLTVLQQAIYGLVATKGASLPENAAAVTGLSAVLHDPVDHHFGIVHSNAVCAAYALIPGSPTSPAWQNFVDGLSDAKLQPNVLAFVSDPARCASGLPF